MNQARGGLRVQGLSKTFVGQRALVDVDLEVKSGEIHALLGQNGSGKSTLIKILAGFHAPDPGSAAWVNGESFVLGSAAAAHRAGLRFIHQDLGLVPDMDVIDNLALGATYERRWWLRHATEAKAARKVLAELSDEIEVTRPLRELSPAQQTTVAIARALRGGVSSNGVLILDEPTSTLPAAEVDVLFRVVRRVRAAGAAVIYITHRIGEVFDLADTVSVLRDGVKVASGPVADTDKQSLIAHIAGRPLDQIYPSVTPAHSKVVMTAHGITGRSVRDFDLALHEGEIVGVAGLDGSGREEINRLLFGQQPINAGEVHVGNDVIRRPDPIRSIRAGIGYLPPDRRHLSATPAMSVAENITLSSLSARPLSWLGYRSERRAALHWMSRLQIRPAQPDRPLSTLSGGNQQKAILARWLRRQSTVLLMDEPTQGVDVGGKQGIYQAIAAAASAGNAVLIASTDAEELAELCERVLVLREGRVVAELTGANLTAESVIASSMTEGGAA